VADPTSRPAAARRVIVVGLGNPVLGDDGVGWHVADEVERRLAQPLADQGSQPRPVVDVERLGVGGLRLMEFLDGYDDAILVDAAQFPGRPVGEVQVCPFEELARHAPGHLDSAHDASLETALALGRDLGARLPERIWAVTVQADITDVFGEQLTPEVERAVPTAASAVIGLLGSQRSGPTAPRNEDWSE
jgi:hydrogenase maturation protease